MPEHTDQNFVQRFVEPRDGTQRFYANHLNAQWTPHDISITFSALTKIAEPSEASPRTHTYEEAAVVTLAWTEAKALMVLLGNVVRSYEQLNGEIKIGDIP